MRSASESCITASKIRLPVPALIATTLRAMDINATEPKRPPPHNGAKSSRGLLNAGYTRFRVLARPETGSESELRADQSK